MPKYWTIHGTEANVKRSAVLYARGLGFTVIDTASHLRGPRAGIPDAFIGHRRVPMFWIAVEFKSPRGKLSREQAELHADGMLCVVNSVESMVTVLNTHFPSIVAHP